MAKAAARKSRKRPARKSAARQGGMWRWYCAGLFAVGSILAYEHRAEILPLAEQVKTASIPKSVASAGTDIATRRDASQKPALARPTPAVTTSVMPTPGIRPSEQGPVPPRDVQVASLQPSAPQPGAPRTGAYFFCTEKLENCVVDGGTFWHGRQKVDIADVTIPRIKQAKCDNERKLGSLAKRRLWELLNGSDVSVATSGTHAVVRVRGGRSVGEVLVSEGLAQPRAGGGRGWCAAG